MERGIRRLEIFKEEMDYEIFLIILKKVTEEYEAKVHAYCLMTNHVHLLIETSNYKIGKIMQKIAGDYAKTYNQKYGYRGHLFEDRYVYDAYVESERSLDEIIDMIRNADEWI